MAKKSAKKQATHILVYIIVFIIGALVGFGGLTYLKLPTTDALIEENTGFYSYTSSGATSSVDLSGVSSDLTVHFLELGNKYTGDCTYIKVGENIDILIDCGSRASSISTVVNYLNEYVTDNTLEYVIVTHAHQDHYAGFATGTNVKSIFEYFVCEKIIDFPKTEKTDGALYKKYVKKRDAEVALGADHYTALECYEAGSTPTAEGAMREFTLTEGVTLEILYHKFYEQDASSENDYSVCCMINQAQENNTYRRFLFTGDLDADGETSLKDTYKLDHPENNYTDGSFRVQLYKAGHHGSGTSSNADFLQVFRPEIVCVCCCAGSSEYTDNNLKQFPTQEFIDRIALYTNKIYVTTLCEDYDNNVYTSLNGNIAVCSLATEIKVKCSNNDILLKDTDWFKQNRTCPIAWQEAVSP